MRTFAENLFSLQFVKQSLMLQGFEAIPALILLAVATLVLKEMAKISLSIPVAKTVLGIDTVPALPLLNAENIAKTGFCASAVN